VIRSRDQGFTFRPIAKLFALYEPVVGYTLGKVRSRLGMATLWQGDSLRIKEFLAEEVSNEREAFRSPKISAEVIQEICWQFLLVTRKISRSTDIRGLRAVRPCLLPDNAT
jgi:hypothetical protein